MNSMQHEFDEVVKHLYKQGKPAVDTNENSFLPSCKYRGEGGSMCAVGCRIPDSVYIPRMENLPVVDLVKRYGNLLPPEIKEYEPMFGNLQRVHDAQRRNPVFDFAELEEGLKGVAKEFGLTFTKPEGF
jgi:hypothetical protein